MLKVECESCKAPYQIDERRVPPGGLKMRCPKCGHSFIVANPNAGAAAPVLADLPATRAGTRDGGAELPVAVAGRPGAPSLPRPAANPPPRAPAPPPRPAALTSPGLPIALGPPTEPP